MNIEIDLLDLANDIGMYEAIEYLIQMSKKYTYRVKFKESLVFFDDIIYHHLMPESVFYRVPGDEVAFKVGNVEMSYGFIKTRPSNYVKIVFYDVRGEDIIKPVKNSMEAKNKMRQEIRKRTIDIDPYEEENWLDEKLITKFQVFKKNI